MTTTGDSGLVDRSALLQIFSRAQRENVAELDLSNSGILELPEEIGRLNSLQTLDLSGNRLTSLPESVSQLTDLRSLDLSANRMRSLPQSLGDLTKVKELNLSGNRLEVLPRSACDLTGLERLHLVDNRLLDLPDEIGQLKNLEEIDVSDNPLESLPETIGQLVRLKSLIARGAALTALPWAMARLDKLALLNLDDNSLLPALESAYEGGVASVKAYLQSLEEAELREELYETKLIVIGEGDVGKTTLLNAMSGREPRQGEPPTRGVEVDIQSLTVPHPVKVDVQIQLNAWDFGGQEVYRVTHQFFFSQRSIYLLVWEPRRGVLQCQVEDWLKMIRLRVGDSARVIIVSTHCKTGQRIAQIDKPVIESDYEPMIVGFHKVDSLVNDDDTGEKVGIAELKELISKAASDLPQMGMGVNRNWKTAWGEVLTLEETHIAYEKFGVICREHGLDEIDTATLAGLMNDLGYIVYFGNDDRLKHELILKPEWLTKAIGLVLDDRVTREMDGILPDARLTEVWQHHGLEEEPRYDPELYPFFLRLMERYDVSYRLEGGDASLVAQHVPQVRPKLPWLPDDEPKQGLRRIEMVCVMVEEPPGLVPRMIVRTQEYAHERSDGQGKARRLYWQKGMFLQYGTHGQAMLELRHGKFHVHTEARWPAYFAKVLNRTLHKLITDNWLGMDGRYFFAVPCKKEVRGQRCSGWFDIDALHQFLREGDEVIRCQSCREQLDIVNLLYGFEVDSREQLERIETKIDSGFDDVMKELDGFDSRIAGYFMAFMQAIATESKDGPRLFTIEPVDGTWDWTNKRYRVHLWCEAEGCQHPVLETGEGVYEIKVTRPWLKTVAPYANLIAGVLKTLLPVAGPAANLLFDKQIIDQLKVKDHLDVMKEATAKLLKADLLVTDQPRLRQGLVAGTERSGVLALHSLLRDKDPNHERLGLRRMPTYTGDYLWLCETHYREAQPKIPDRIKSE